MSKSYAVIGAGNGGYAMAGELALLGRDIVLFDFPAFEDRLSPLRKAGGVRVDSRIDHFPGGRGEHFAPLPQITTDISGIASADVVIVVVPGQHHEKVIAAALPHLHDGQLVLLNPGGVGGCLVWASALQKAGRSRSLPKPRPGPSAVASRGLSRVLAGDECPRGRDGRSGYARAPLPMIM